MMFFLVAGAVIVACALGWALGGYKWKNVRRLGVPAVTSIAALFFLGGWQQWVLPIVSFFALWGSTTIGYGIPDPTDEGSPLGRFWYKLLNQNFKAANIMTRLTVGLCYGGSLAILGSFNIVQMLLATAVVAANTVLWGAIIEDAGLPIIPPLTNCELAVGAGVGLGWLITLI